MQQCENPFIRSGNWPAHEGECTVIGGATCANPEPVGLLRAIEVSRRLLNPEYFGSQDRAVATSRRASPTPDRYSSDGPTVFGRGRPISSHSSYASRSRRSRSSPSSNRSSIEAIQSSEPR